MLGMGLGLGLQRQRKAGGGAPAPVTDPHFANVVLLFGVDGTDGAKTANDESSKGHVLTFSGNAQLTTAQKKFGTASYLGDGSSLCFVSEADSDDWRVPGEFTVECWVRPAFSNSTVRSICGQWTNQASSNNNFYIDYAYSSATVKRFGAAFSPDGTTASKIDLTQATTNIDQSAFHHVCLERDASNKLRLYVGGVMVASATVAGGVDANSPFAIGGRTTGVNAQPFNGWIDEFRFTKGVARYASDSGFAVPTAAFPRS